MFLIIRCYRQNLRFGKQNLPVLETLETAFTLPCLVLEYLIHCNFPRHVPHWKPSTIQFTNFNPMLPLPSFPTTTSDVFYTSLHTQTTNSSCFIFSPTKVSFLRFYAQISLQLVWTKLKIKGLNWVNVVLQVTIPYCTYGMEILSSQKTGSRMPWLVLKLNIFSPTKLFAGWMQHRKTRGACRHTNKMCLMAHIPCTVTAKRNNMAAFCKYTHIHTYETENVSNKITFIYSLHC